MANVFDLQEHFHNVAHRMLGEKLIPLGKAATFLSATRGEKVSPSSLCRWILRGKHGVRLDAVRMGGGGWWTSREALARFAAALSAIAAGRSIPTPTPSELERRHQAALARMRADGVRC